MSRWFLAVSNPGNILCFVFIFSNQSLLTTQERDIGVVVRMCSGENVSVIVLPGTIYGDIAGQDKQLLLILENN